MLLRMHSAILPMHWVMLLQGVLTDVFVMCIPADTGGWTEDALSYAASAGVASESEYPYLAANSYCRYALHCNAPSGT